MAESTEKKTVAERVADLSEEVLESVESGQRAAIEAVRKFVDTTDEETSDLVDASTLSHSAIVEAAMELADELVRTHVQFLRSVFNNATAALKSDAKPPAD